VPHSSSDGMRHPSWTAPRGSGVTADSALSELIIFICIEGGLTRCYIKINIPLRTAPYFENSINVCGYFLKYQTVTL
jgi:hypothetical protein